MLNILNIGLKGEATHKKDIRVMVSCLNVFYINIKGGNNVKRSVQIWKIE